MLQTAKNLLKDLLESAHVDDGHGIDHAQTVLHHATRALQLTNLPDETQLAIKLAALLHDADDHKFFPDNNDNENTKCILNAINLSKETRNLVIKMINLVSCSKNRNTPANPEWLLIPRAADRLEAMGYIGIKRCYDYTKHTTGTSKSRPLFTNTTPRATNIKELNSIATAERFEKYRGGSDSMIDHFYDKVLHLVDLKINNKYLQSVATERHAILVDFCLEFGKTGKVPYIENTL